MKKTCERCKVARLERRFPKNSSVCHNCLFYGGVFVGRKVLTPREREILIRKGVTHGL